MAATCRLAAEKACAVRHRLGPAAVILGADTTVVLGGRIFGKPRDAEDAARMLGELAGRGHMVVTGWAILPADCDSSAGTVGYTKSWVGLRELSTGNLLGSLNQGIGDHVALGDAAEYVHQDPFDLRVAENDFEGFDRALGADAAANVEKVRRLAAV